MTRAASNAKDKPVHQGSAATQSTVHRFEAVFAWLLGGFLGLSLLKFGNPVIMEKFVDWPTNPYEWVLNPWPVVIGYWLLGGVAVIGLVIARWKVGAPRWLVAMPLIWLIWECISMTVSRYPEISRPTVLHFATCVLCFYLGLFALGRVRRLMPFWLGLMVGMLFVVAFGFEQRFGGLEDTRRYWLLYLYPKMQEVPPMLMKKMQSTRIFSTLFYPNTLAEVILLLLPVILFVIESCRERFTVGARRLLMGLVGGGMLACLVWSGSKGGWLLLLVMGIVATLFMSIPKQLKLLLVGAVLVLGLTGFFLKYAGFFKKGATSVVARFDYWEAALKTARAKPVFGNGPGAFGKAYEPIKRPESEMALMTHNDYLEQASDSGLPGFVSFTAWILGGLVYAWRKGRLGENGLRLAVWLGLLAWALQSFVEFGLYIPAMAWLAFVLLGWLLAQDGNEIDRNPAAG